jgi:hypothetical protein
MNSAQRIKSYCFFFAVPVLVAMLMVFAYSPATASAADQENCMFCHQYPLLGVVDDSGALQSFFVSENQWAMSVHAGLLCTDCHREVTKIPHNTKDKRVDCTAACHNIIEPATGRPFSHQSSADALAKSIHSVDNAHVRNRVAADFPTCTSCHRNDPNSVSVVPRTWPGMSDVVLNLGRARCEECHQNRYDFVDRTLVHAIRRTERPRTPQQIVDMCSPCHNNAELNARHGLVNAIWSYRENYHGKTMILGLEAAPSCMDCHLLEGNSSHGILSVKDPNSATHPNNRGTMCSRADCHPGTNMRSYIHWEIDFKRYPVQYVLLVAFTILTVASFLGLMVIMVMEMFRMIFPTGSIHTMFGGKK